VASAAAGKRRAGQGRKERTAFRVAKLPNVELPMMKPIVMTLVAVLAFTARVNAQNPASFQINLPGAPFGVVVSRDQQCARNAGAIFSNSSFASAWLPSSNQPMAAAKWKVSGGSNDFTDQ
jgi:hypothetical protein